MEITKVVKPFIRRGANTFGNIVLYKYLVFLLLFLVIYIASYHVEWISALSANV